MSGIEAATSSTPAPYGRACVNCARAKCRCIYRVTDTSCERCHRLNKACSPSVSVRKRNGRRQVGSRTAQLEEKLADLVTLLRNQNTVVKQKPPPVNATTTAPRDLWGHTPAPSHASQTDTAPTAERSDGRADSNPSGRSPVGPQSPGEILSAAFDPALFQHSPVIIPISSMIDFPAMPSTQKEAEDHLLLFRERYLQCFPCVYIPPAMSSAQLRDEKPFTWFTIMMVSCQTSAFQFAMGGIWQKIVAQKIVIEHDKNLDILQGHGNLLGLYHKKDKPYLAIFTQLALSLVYDLSLNKLPGDPSALSCFKTDSSSQHLANRERTMEDRRTVLACFYITSQIAYTLRKMDGLRWTAHLNDCITFLDEHPEWPGDQMLVAQVRIQLIIDQTSSGGLAGQPSTMPPYYNLSALLLPTETIRSQLSQGLEDNALISIQLVYAELVILENGVCRALYNPKKPDFRRYEILSTIADTLKRWFDKFFPLSEEYYTALAFAEWCQLAHCLMSLFKLSTLDEPAWDRAALRRDIDVIQVCDRVISDMDVVGAYRRRNRPDMGAATLPQYPGDTDIFSVCTRMLVSMRNGWASELGVPPLDVADVTVHKPLAENGFIDTVEPSPLAVPFNLLDDSWLTDVFNVSWE